jgi:hypothetical protein
MAADREWFTIEKPNGAWVDGKEYPNKEAAAQAARLLAPECNERLTVVKYTRKEVRTFTPTISITEADVGTVTPA